MEENTDGRESKTLSRNDTPVFHILQYPDGHTSLVAEFGLGRLGLGLGSNETDALNVELYELRSACPLGTIVDPDNVKIPEAFDITLRFPTVDSVDNFISILQNFRKDIFGNGKEGA